MRYLNWEENFRKVLAEYSLENLLEDDCQSIQFEAGETITEMGEKITHLYLVMDGRAKAFRLADNGNHLIVCQYISTGLVGEIELLTDRDIATTTVTAISPFTCIAIPYQTCRQELKRNLQFSNALGRILAEKLAGSADNYVSSALYTGQQRLCTYILRNVNGDHFCENMTEVAASIGMSYRHMYRVLNELCRKEILRKTKTGYTIADRDALNSFAIR